MCIIIAALAEPVSIAESERVARLALSLTEGVGAMSGRKLIEAFGSAEKVFAADPRQVEERGRLKPGSAVGLKKSLPAAEAELARLKALGGWLLVWGEEVYPRLLTHIHAPPLALFGLGGFLAADERAVAVVGSRQATEYGRKTTQRLAAELASLGITVVSGLAVGIDTAAHIGALEAGGRTIAVLGSGLDVDYPRENARLKEQIIASGTVLTEYPLGTQPAPWRFPVRNRIIAGLAGGVVVAEASPRSGSLITASHALEGGRTVMAVPGPVTDRRREGTHELIRQGAALVASGRQAAGEIWPELDFRPSDAPMETEPDLSGLDKPSRLVYSLIEAVPRHVDEIIRAADLSPEEVQGRLFDLELRGLAQRLPGQMFARS